MITNVTVDLSAIRESREAIYRHVGFVIVTCAEIDQRVVSLLGRLTTSSVPPSFGDRVKMLTRELGSWPDTAALARALTIVSLYRNGLGHSALVSLISVADGTTRHNAVRERNQMKLEPIAEADIPKWDLRASILDFVLLGLDFDVRNNDLANARVRAIAQGLRDVPTADLSDATAFLFGR